MSDAFGYDVARFVELAANLHFVAGPVKPFSVWHWAQRVARIGATC